MAYLQASCNDKLCCVVVLMCCVVELLRCLLFYLCVVVRVICVAWRCVRYLCGLEGWALIVICVGSTRVQYLRAQTSTACILRSNVRS